MKNKNIKNLIKETIVLAISLVLIMPGIVQIVNNRIGNIASAINLDSGFTMSIENTTANPGEIDHVFRINGSFVEDVAFYNAYVEISPIGSITSIDFSFDGCVGVPEPNNWWGGLNASGDFFYVSAFYDPGDEISADSGTLFNVITNIDEDILPGIINLDFVVGDSYSCYFNTYFEYREPEVTNGCIDIVNPSDPPDTPSLPSGPNIGYIGYEYTYSTSTTDPNGDQVYYKWDFGDEVTDWIGPFNSGDAVYQNHIWDIPDLYDVKVKAKDDNDAISPWSDILEVNITNYFVMEVINTTGLPYEEGIVVSINGTWTQDIGSYSLKLYFDPEMLEFVNFNLDDTVGENPHYINWHHGNDNFNILVQTVNPIDAGSGALVKILFNITCGSGVTDIVLDPSVCVYNLYPSGQVVAGVINGVVEIVNYPPNIPNQPDGPTSGITGEEYTYSIDEVEDPDGDNVFYLFDWGDGTDSGWQSSTNASHIWTIVDEYEVMAKAKDIYDAESNFSEPLLVTITNNPPEIPDKPDGPDVGVINEEYSFSTKTTDPNGHQVYYKWDFGDEVTDWIGPFDSDEIVMESHEWGIPGSYKIKVMARDDYEGMSDWSNEHSIQIKGPDIGIGSIKGGILEVSAEIENIGDIDANYIEWSISVTGGIFNLINVSNNGTIDTLESGVSELGIAGPIFGLGAVKITVSAKAKDGDLVYKTVKALVIGPFIIGVI